MDLGLESCQGAHKRNPAVGAPGWIVIVIGVYGFKYAAWLLVALLR